MKTVDFNSNLTFHASNWRMSVIGSNNGLVPISQQTFVWTNDIDTITSLNWANVLFFCLQSSCCINVCSYPFIGQHMLNSFYTPQCPIWGHKQRSVLDRLWLVAWRHQATAWTMLTYVSWLQRMSMTYVSWLQRIMSWMYKYHVGKWH